MGRKVVRRLDTRTEQAVWSRVRAPGGVTAQEAVLPERLEALILEEQAQAGSLRALARRLRGPGGSTLGAQANRTEARVRELETLHYLLTGRRLRMQAPKPPAPEPLSEALRQAALASRQTERSYRALGEEFTDWAEDFDRFARQTQERTRAVTRVLQGTLPEGSGIRRQGSGTAP